MAKGKTYPMTERLAISGEDLSTWSKDDLLALIEELLDRQGDLIETQWETSLELLKLEEKDRRRLFNQLWENSRLEDNKHREILMHIMLRVFEDEYFNSLGPQGPD